jgi:tetratricopeptide (TPR) repeat protein
VYLGDADRGIAQYRLALDIRRQLVAKDPGSAPFRRSVAWSHTKLGNAYADKGDVPHAIEAHEQALALRGKLVEESPGQGSFRNELASTEVALGKLVAVSDPGRSKQLINAGLTRSRALVAGDPLNNEWKETFTQGLVAQADAARATNDARTREAALTEALAVARGAAERSQHNVHWPGFLAEIHAGLAELASARGDRPAAAAAWRVTRDLLEPLATANRLAAQRKALLERARAQR